LQDVEKANWKFALRLFQCVAVASRPLRVEELAEFLAFDFEAGPTPTFQAGWRPEDPISAVLSTCPNLLYVVNAEGSAFIQFSHFSVREFLTSSRLAETRDIISRYHVSMTPAHTIMAQACLGILLHLDENVTNDTLKNLPLAEYAAKNWVDHARFDVSQSTQDGMKRLFDPRRPHFAILVWIYDRENSWMIRPKRPLLPRGTYLHYATLSGLPSLVKFLVTEFTPDLNARCFFDAVTPLHLASRDGHAEVARVLLEHGADVDAGDKSNRTPLRRALNRKQVEVAQVLIKNNAYIGVQGEDRWTPLHWASEHRQVELAQALLEYGADMNARDLYGWSPCRCALYQRHVEVVRVFVQHTSSARLQNKRESTQLHEVSEDGHVDFARMLLKCGADASARDENNVTPLHLALERGHREVALVLLEHGADASVQDVDKWTFLHLASRYGLVKVARALLDHGADASVQNDEMWTPLHFASYNGHTEVARALLDHGADASVQEERKWTPLHLASQNGHTEVARALLEHGADASVQNERKWTPLHLASQNGHTEVARALLEHGSDPSVQNENNSTPLHIALQCLCHTVSTTFPPASSCEHVEVAGVILEHVLDTIPELTQDQREQMARLPGITQSLLISIST
jgi:ankyrin repeat protein